MPCLTEEVRDPLFIMEELLVTKRAFDWERKNFSKLLKDIHCYLTAGMLLLMVPFLYRLKPLKILLTLLLQLEISPGNKWEDIYQKNINMSNQVYKNYTMLKEFCSHSNILLWIFKGRFAEPQDLQINQVFNVIAVHSWVNRI